MGENGLDDVMMARLGSSLKTHIRLHMLFLDNNRITREGSQHVAECLKGKQDLRVFNIDNNKIGAEGASVIGA